MAKKNPNGTAAGSAPRRASRRKAKSEPAAAPIDLASVTPVEPIDAAADMGSAAARSAYQPTYEDIAREAYQRYLRRGGTDGRDFDDWIEAERALVNRHTR